MFVIHSERACPDRTETCHATHRRLTQELDAAPISCVISDTSDLTAVGSVCVGGSKAAADRLVKHAAAWALAVKAGRGALVMEDDVVLHDISLVSKFGQQRKHECVVLGRWGSAYMVTAATADKLLSHFARSRRPADIATELQSALRVLCLSSVVHAAAAVDGSDAGDLMPSVAVGKPHPASASVMSLDAAHDLYKTTGHPDVAVKYAAMLVAEGYMVKAYEVFAETMDKVRGRPDGMGSTPFTRAFVELFKGASPDLQPFTSSGRPCPSRP